MRDGRQLSAMIGGDRPVADEFVRSVEANELNKLTELPGFAGAKRALRQNSDRLSALEQMEAAGKEVLPVVDAEGKLIGVVNRSRLLSGLLSEVV